MAVAKAVAAAAAGADVSRVARIPRAPRTPGVGLSDGDLCEWSGTPKEESKTSGRQRYHLAVVLTVYTPTDHLVGDERVVFGCCQLADVSEVSVLPLIGIYSSHLLYKPIVLTS